MNDVVVDTVVASYMLVAHPVAERYLDAMGGSLRFLSFMSVAELRAGAFLARWGNRRRAVLEKFISTFQII